MMKLKNDMHIEGLLYQHNLEKKISGAKSANPGTEYITGTIDIATDNACLNIVQIHYTYVVEKTKKGTINATYTALNNIINGNIHSIMEHGIDKATRLRADSAIGLNEFYSDRSGKEELVSVKRNEGGFLHTTQELKEAEVERCQFEADMVITQVTHIEASEDTNTPEKAAIKGYIFDFRNALLPVEFVTVHPGAINYFEGLEATENNPTFTRVRGTQISETIVKTIVEESAFGEPSVKEVKRNRKEYLVNWARPEEYLWDDESSITVAEFIKAKTDRDLYLATLKQNRDEYKANKTANTSASIPVGATFKF